MKRTLVMPCVFFSSIKHAIAAITINLQKMGGNMKISKCDFYHAMDLQCRSRTAKDGGKELFEFKKHLGKKCGYTGEYGIDSNRNVIFAGWLC